jgi:pimeloyl-ACP methyl ester carboxylesterase
MAEDEPDGNPHRGPQSDDYARSDGEWMRTDWADRVRLTVVESDLGSTPVNYVDTGEGPPVLLVHGLGGSWRNWLENIPYLSRRHRVIALDLPGFGTSPLPDRQLSIRTYGDLLVSFADRLELGPDTALVGHSMGGFISTEAAIVSPERFSSLILVAAAGVTYARFTGSRKDLAKVIVEAMMPVAASGLERNFGRSRLRAAQFAGVFAHPSRINREMLWELGSYAVDAPGLIQAAYALAGYDTRDRLPEIRIPTLLVWGSRDLLVPVPAAFAYRRRIPDAELCLLDDTGHMIQMERPARFNDNVEEFIDRRRRGNSGAAPLPD